MSNPAKTKTAPVKSRYKGDRRATTVVLSGALVRLGQDYFPETNHGSLSAFLESALASYVRKNATRIRAKGNKIPEAVFTS